MKELKDYLKNPNTKNFLDEEFNKMRFGATRPAEMELLLFYMFAYNNDDLDKSEFELANKYFITESKAAKFKIEISKRFMNNDSNSKIIHNLAIRIFEKKDEDYQPIDFIDDKVQFLVNDSVEARVITQELENCKISNLYEGTSKKTFRLTKPQFIAFFIKYYDDLVSKIQNNLTDEYKRDKSYEALFNKSKPTVDKILDILDDDIVKTGLNLIIGNR